MKIGYVVPEFPGSTHIFFWRELRALEQAGIACEIVSTHKPDQSRVSHSWSEEGMRRTTYLLPPRIGRVLGGFWEMFRGGPFAWTRCLRGVLGAAGVKGWRGRARLSGLAILGGQLAWLARRRGWRHVHVHSCADSANIAMFARLLSGLSYSITLHGHMGDYGPNQRNKWKRAAFATVITNRLLEVVRAELDGSLPSIVEVAPMGVEVEAFERKRPYQPWDGAGPARVFSCGRLNPCKGHDQLIRAIGLLVQRGLDVTLHIAGADDYASQQNRVELARIIDELKLHGHVKLLGAVAEEKVREGLESAHVFALASRRDELGVATMEAMAMGLPVVVSRSGGIVELVADGEDGLLVEPENPAQMAEAIHRVLRDPDLARRLGEAGRQKVRQKFHSGVSAEVLRRCLTATVSPRPEGERSTRKPCRTPAMVEPLQQRQT